MQSFLVKSCCLIASLLACSTGLTAESTDRQAGIEFFEKRIRPVLVQSCYECHSGKADEPGGGLLLDSRAGVLKGGESGAGVVPGNPADSLLIAALRYESFEMPPKNQLPKEVITDFVKWIEMGAPDPRDTADSTSDADSWQTILLARRDWWSLQPVVDPPIPTNGADWAKGAIDHFIARELDAAGITIAPTAEAATLARRLSLVLTGLPPEWEAVQRFEREYAQDAEAAYELFVDRLLASPHFGERWARHWMDVVRFTETHGNEWNYEVHHAWRYRDYLIRAFNDDVPYDQFVREHIAGDLIAPRWNKNEQINEALIGTSFYRFGEVNHDDCVELTSIGYDILDNQIDTLSKAFQATTIACARCHHHKIDAVSMYDYYGLLGILKSSRLTAHTLDADSVNARPIEQLRQLKPLIRGEVARLWQMQVGDVTRYLLAADAQLRAVDNADALAEGLDANRLAKWVAALQLKNVGSEHPIRAWQQFTTASDMPGKWAELSVEFQRTRADHERFNTEQFTAFGDFRVNETPATSGGVTAEDSAEKSAVEWWSDGQGLRNGASPSGEFTIADAGEKALASLLPGGTYTHVVSQKLNGTLRSPVPPAGAKYISVQVVGDKTSAFRLVSNNCQLNYANYRALTYAKPTWVTYPIPEHGQELNTFAELVTKFDNPKFPDQLGTLGGDRTNDRIPWSEAAADPRSYFGIMQAVLHQQPEPPKADLSPLEGLFLVDKANAIDTAITRERIAERYANVLQRAVDRWSHNMVSDADVAWLSWAIEFELLDHSLAASPRLQELVMQYREIEDKQIQRPRIAAGVAEPCGGDGYDHPLFIRGDYQQPGQPVPRQYLEVISATTVVRNSADGPTKHGFSSGSGRGQLAEIIAAADNPLTARVMVNRIWHHLFGTGIVRTVDDFGQVGDLPSHPEMLDFLAARFVQPASAGGMGWSVKSLIRSIVLSQLFRTSSRLEDPARIADPQNRLLQHYPARRMEAEAIRDSLLAVSGRLDRTQFGMSIQPFREKPNEFRRLFAGPLDGNGRRSVYTKINLMEGPEFLGAFNIPGGKIAQGRRDVTNVPAQALTLLNDQFVLQQAEVWGKRVVVDASPNVADRLTNMLRNALGREPTAVEVQSYAEFARSLASLHGVADSDVLTSVDVWRDVAHVLFNLKEFIYIP